MARTCIICGGATGSREHIFPAALGGRRTNKGIYCGTHNGAFSPLAAVLSEQLELINALLAVRPDHAEKPRSMVLDGPGGHTFRLSGNDIQPEGHGPTPHVKRGEEQSLSFANEAAAQAWITEQRAKGFGVRITSREARRRYFTDPINVRLVLGGPDGFRSIAYVALTLLAHHFPEVARSPGLGPIKGYIQKLNDTPHVWWGDPAPVLGKNPFRFGHSIAIVVSPSAGRTWARVKLFSSLIFCVDLGSVDAGPDESVVTFIDPLADHPPNDIVERRILGRLFECSRPADLTEHLRRMNSSGAGEVQLTQLIQNIEVWNKQQAFTPLVDEILQASDLPPAERTERIQILIDKQAQRIVNLMTFVAKRYEMTKTAEAAPIMALFAEMTTSDYGRPSGLSPIGEAVLAVAVARLVREVEAESHSMTLDRLTLLLAGGPGAAMVGEEMLEIALDQLFPQRGRDSGR